MTDECKASQEQWENFEMITSKTSQKQKTQTKIKLNFYVVVCNGVHQLDIQENDGQRKPATFASLDKYKKEVTVKLLMHYCNYRMCLF